MSRPRAIEIDDLLLDAADLGQLLRLLVGSVVVRPDGLTFTVQRDGHQLCLRPIDPADLMPPAALN